MCGLLGAGAARPPSLYCFFRMVKGWEPIGLSFAAPTSGYTDRGDQVAVFLARSLPSKTQRYSRFRVLDI